MNDQEIVKALRCCAQAMCDDCPMPNTDGICKWRPKMYINAADVIKRLTAEVERYKQWVNDLQSGMYVNCVYCGHRYGAVKDTPVSMADVLKEHIEHCPEHPMSKLKADNEHLTLERDAAIQEVKSAILSYSGKVVDLCMFCANRHVRGDEYPCSDCDGDKWMWEGIEENKSNE